MDTGTLSRDKTVRRESWLLPSISAEVNREWSYTSTPPYAFMLWTLKTIF